MIVLIRPFPAPLDQLYNWQPGDHITHLDGRAVEDMLDLYYYTPEDLRTELRIARTDGQTVTVTMDPADVDAVTGCFAPMVFKTCACDCVFCFIDQNPTGMRDAIYVKDEDYRFSFLYGNYITLTSLTKKGLRRIKDQRMSPLYVSVHATDLDVRTRMLGIKRRIDVLTILGELCEAGIEIHTQVVLCPGWNDGEVLRRTFTDLLELGAKHEDDTSPFNAVCERGHGYDAADAQPNPGVASGLERGGIRSLAIVPVGLSAHRQGLTRLEAVTPELASRTIDDVNIWQEQARSRLGFSFVYLSDEFYLLADRPFPETASYDGFWQVDNAIGLTPRLRDTWAEELDWARDDGDLPTRPVTVLTGELAARAWQREFTPVLTAAGAPPVEVVGVQNRFYGNTVTVAGLLSGADVRRALVALPPEPKRQVVLSPRIFNADELTLDDMTLADIAADQPHQVSVGAEDGFIAFWQNLD